MVKSAGTLSSSGVVVMGAIGVTTLLPLGPGSPELPPPPEVLSPLSKDSSWRVCPDSGLLCTISMNTAPESFPSGERLRLSK
jgi:hypothetical protein